MNKIHLKDLAELKKDYEKDPIKFKSRIEKADALIGPTDSMLFVEKIMKTT